METSEYVAPRARRSTEFDYIRKLSHEGVRLTSATPEHCQPATTQRINDIACRVSCSQDLLCAWIVGQYSLLMRASSERAGRVWWSGPTRCTTNTNYPSRVDMHRYSAQQTASGHSA
jgi:hypothetical protein